MNLIGRAQIIRVLIREKYPANYCPCLFAEGIAAKTMHFSNRELHHMIDVAYKKVQQEPYYSFNAPLTNGRCIANGSCMNTAIFNDVLKYMQ
jgi:hypothetical protein